MMPINILKKFQRFFELGIQHLQRLRHHIKRRARLTDAPHGGAQLFQPGRVELPNEPVPARPSYWRHDRIAKTCKCLSRSVQSAETPGLTIVSARLARVA